MYQKTLKLSIIFIYLIIIAGAVVRMTGSGMGCPDWPKCFGYLVPPTEEAELLWKPNVDYKSGQVIIVGESLRVAGQSFTSNTIYDEDNWETYDKHDYAVFNVWHTWIEYINRLVTVLAGIPILFMIIFSFWYWRGRGKLIFASFFVLPLMGFQAWLGKEVVDSNLLPVKITIHMVVALLILALLLYLRFKTKHAGKALAQTVPAVETLTRNKTQLRYFKIAISAAVIFTLIQVMLGTQVRQYVDIRVDEVGYAAKSSWLNPTTLWFYIHRSFSIVVVVINGYLFWSNRKYQLRFSFMNAIAACIAIEAFSGIIMYYAHFPFGTQPIHLVIASILFGLQFYVLLESFWKTKSVTALS